MSKGVDAAVAISFVALALGRVAPEMPVARWLQGAAIVCFAVCVPVAFAGALRRYFAARTGRALAAALAPLFLFTIVLGGLNMGGVATRAAGAAMKTMEDTPARAALRGLAHAEARSTRRRAAQLVYRTSGVRVPYKVAEDRYALYVPTDRDERHREEAQQSRGRIDRAANDFLAAHANAIRLNLFVVSAFFVMFAASMLLGHLRPDPR